MKYGFLLFSLLFVWNQSDCQKPIWEKIPIASSEQILDILVDSVGLLRILTTQKLYSFDGLQLNEELTIHENHSFSSFCEKEKAIILIGNQVGEIIEFNPFLQTKIVEQIFDSNWAISSITNQPSSGTRIYFSRANGLKILNPSIDTILTFDHFNANTEIISIDINQSHVWLTSDRGLIQMPINPVIQLEAEVINQTHGLSDILVTQINATDSVVFFSDFDQTIQSINSNGDIESYPFDNRAIINDIHLVKNTLFIAREDGLFVLSNKKWKKISPHSGSDSILKITSDKEGNIYILNGKNQLFQGSLAFQKYSTSIHSAQALESIGNDIWVGKADGLYIFKKDTIIKVNDKNTTCIKKQNEIIWVGTYSDGLQLCNSQGILIASLSKWGGFTDQTILSISLDSTGVIVSTLSGISKIKYKLGKKDLPSLEANPIIDTSINDDYVYQTIVADDRLYLATEGEGLKIFSKETTKKVNQFVNGKKIGSVYSMAFDHLGKLWFTSLEGGLGYYQNEVAIQLELNQRNTSVYTSVISLPNNFLLLIGAHSVDLLNTESLDIISKDKLNASEPTESFLNVFHHDSTQIIFEHKNELFLFDLYWLQKLRPSIFLNQVLVNLEGEIGKSEYHQNENNIQFHFKGVWLTDPEKLTYRYKLEGFDREWRQTKDQHAEYPNLPPGSYTFLVSTAYNGISSNHVQATYKFEIKRKFYNTIWFLLASIIAFFIIIRWFWINKKRKELKNSEIEKKHIEAQLIHLKKQLNPHFLFNSFNTLMGLIEEAPDKSLDFVEKLTDFYRILLDHGKEPLVPLEEEIKLIKLYTDILNVRFANAIQLSIDDYPLNLRIPPLTLQLLIENAVKHNQFDIKHKLEIEIHYDDQYIIVKNNLTPKTFPARSLGHGLENIKRRYQILGHGNINIQVKSDSFCVSLPLISSN